MWNKLLRVYEQKFETFISMVQTRFYQLVKASNDDMVTHISKVESISERLKQLGELISDSMIMTKILNTLPAAYNHLESAWDSIPKAERMRDNLMSRLLTEKLRMQLAECGESSSSTVTLSTKAKFEKKPKAGRSSQQKKKCDAASYNCDERGHYSRECPKKPKEKKSAASDGHAFVSTAMHEQQCTSDDDWYVDSGATDHITNKFGYFATYEEFDSPIQVKIGDSMYIDAEGRGTINISCLVDGVWYDMAGVL